MVRDRVLGLDINRAGLRLLRVILLAASAAAWVREAVEVVVVQEEALLLVRQSNIRSQNLLGAGVEGLILCPAPFFLDSMEVSL